MVDQNLIRAWQLALSEERVIYGALKKERVWRRNDYWADFVQEGRLVYVQAYQRYQKQHPDFELDGFNVYAYQAIRWHVRNLLRRDQWLQERSSVQLDQTPDLELALLQVDFPVQAVALRQCLATHYGALTSRQRVILQQHLLLGQPLASLAPSLQVTPRTLRQDRQKLLAYFREIWT